MVQVKNKRHVFSVAQIIGIALCVSVLGMGTATFLAFAGGAEWGTMDFGILMFIGVVCSILATAAVVDGLCEHNNKAMHHNEFY